MKHHQQQQIGAGEFKAKCLHMLDEVQRSRTEVVITKRGRPVARLVPVEEGEPRPLLGRMKGTIKILGDVVGPTGERWSADA
jgi:prevent-host-death family protein